MVHLHSNESTVQMVLNILTYSVVIRPKPQSCDQHPKRILDAWRLLMSSSKCSFNVNCNLVTAFSFLLSVKLFVAVQSNPSEFRSLKKILTTN
jgi:hypothetical protein